MGWSHGETPRQQMDYKSVGLDTQNVDKTKKSANGEKMISSATYNTPAKGRPRTNMAGKT